MNEMREDLFNREQQMQMMLSGIAHEVRNPLGGIELFSGFLREELQDDSPKLQHVYRIEHELNYLKKVVNEFLDYARRSPLALTEINLGALLTEIANLMELDASNCQVKLVLAVPPKPMLILCDPDQTKRAVINLARNAIQATQAGGEIILRCGTSVDGPFCEVQDSGQGIEPELIEKIFTPFFTTREKGTGLGLAFVKKIVEKHQGLLKVESKIGQGSIFRLIFPRKQDDGDHTHC
jgi:signal transduction histidine kinase